jgi:hypothetical protein
MTITSYIANHDNYLCLDLVAGSPHRAYWVTDMDIGW